MIVQPDFSIVVIGVNPTPAIELAPFCERGKGTAGMGAGAIVLKITRDSIVKAIANGLDLKQIVDRLKKHASNELPSNVAKEIKHWSEWTKRTTIETLTVIDCPDRDTADRVAACLGKRGRRLGDLLVALESANLPAGDRVKLKGQGVLLETKAPAQAKKKKNAKAKRSVPRYREYVNEDDDDGW